MVTEEGDLQTLALGHTDINSEDMFDLEPQIKQWLNENTFFNEEERTEGCMAGWTKKN